MYKNKIIFGILLLALLLFGCAGGSETPIVSETVDIYQDETQFWYGELKEGQMLIIDLKVTTGGPIDVMVLDSQGYGAYNYNLGGGTEDVTSIEHAVGVKEYKKEIKMNAAGTYYVVVDNTEFPAEGTSPVGTVTVKAEIKKKS